MKKNKMDLLKGICILLLSTISLFVSAQTTVTGTVTNGEGEALIGVTVRVTGTSSNRNFNWYNYRH